MKSDLTTLNFSEGAMLLVNKPLEWTSFQAVNKIKYLLKKHIAPPAKPKIGHSGTLDPLATGLLILCTGKWTKKLTDLTGLPKVYTGSITLGSVTPTYDLESEPKQFKSIEHLSEAEIYKATQLFMGTIEQLPPIHSAIKQNGKPIYLAARKGEEVLVKPRTITITEFQIEKIELPKVYFRVACTSGTYIRSLAHDFGAALQVGGHLSSLCREQIGDYMLQDAHSLEELIAALSSTSE